MYLGKTDKNVLFNNDLSFQYKSFTNSITNLLNLHIRLQVKFAMS